MKVNQIINCIADNNILIIERTLVLIFIILFISTALDVFLSQNQEFIYQAEGFLHGTVFYHTYPFSAQDSSLGLGGYYWPLGPLPAVLLIPFVAGFGIIMIQQYLIWFFIVISFWFCYKLARKFNYSINDSLLLGLAFIFGSVYFGIAFSGGAVWQFATAISTVLVLATLDEHFNKRRYWLMGIYLACAFATRFTAGLAVIYVMFDTLFNQQVVFKHKIKQLTMLLIPVLLVGLSLLWLNYARTGNVLDSGYRSSIMKVDSSTYRIRDHYGLFSLKNIPTNIYYYFLIPPKPITEPDSLHLIPPYFTLDIGLGFFYISPIFLLIFRSAWKKKEQILAGITAGVILFILLTYYAINDHWFGTYYLADVLPFFFILLLYALADKGLHIIGRVLIYFSLFFNYYILFVYTILKI